MVYHVLHFFDDRYDRYTREPLTPEQKIEIAKKKAAQDLAEELLKNSKFEVDKDGNVRGAIYVAE